jgi:trimeric autotransporter adhesin
VAAKAVSMRLLPGDGVARAAGGTPDASSEHVEAGAPRYVCVAHVSQLVADFAIWRTSVEEGAARAGTDAASPPVPPAPFCPHGRVLPLGAQPVAALALARAPSVGGGDATAPAAPPAGHPSALLAASDVHGQVIHVWALSGWAREGVASIGGAGIAGLPTAAGHHHRPQRSSGAGGGLSPALAAVDAAGPPDRRGSNASMRTAASSTASAGGSTPSLTAAGGEGAEGDAATLPPLALGVPAAGDGRPPLPPASGPTAQAQGPAHVWSYDVPRIPRARLGALCDRGVRVARITRLAFSSGGRWLCATTDRGTSHMFALPATMDALWGGGGGDAWDGDHGSAGDSAPTVFATCRLRSDLAPAGSSDDDTGAVLASSASAGGGGPHAQQASRGVLGAVLDYVASERDAARARAGDAAAVTMGDAGAGALAGILQVAADAVLVGDYHIAVNAAATVAACHLSATTSVQVATPEPAGHTSTAPLVPPSPPVDAPSSTTASGWLAYLPAAAATLTSVVAKVAGGVAASAADALDRVVGSSHADGVGVPAAHVGLPHADARLTVDADALGSWDLRRQLHWPDLHVGDAASWPHEVGDVAGSQCHVGAATSDLDRPLTPRRLGRLAASARSCTTARPPELQQPHGPSAAPGEAPVVAAAVAAADAAAAAAAVARSPASPGVQGVALTPASAAPPSPSLASAAGPPPSEPRTTSALYPTPPPTAPPARAEDVLMAYSRMFLLPTAGSAPPAAHSLPFAAPAAPQPANARYDAEGVLSQSVVAGRGSGGRAGHSAAGAAPTAMQHSLLAPAAFLGWGGDDDAADGAAVGGGDDSPALPAVSTVANGEDVDAGLDALAAANSIAALSGPARERTPPRDGDGPDGDVADVDWLEALPVAGPAGGGGAMATVAEDEDAMFRSLALTPVDRTGAMAASVRLPALRTGGVGLPPLHTASLHSPPPPPPPPPMIAGAGLRASAAVVPAVRPAAPVALSGGAYLALALPYDPAHRAHGAGDREREGAGEGEGDDGPVSSGGSATGSGSEAGVSSAGSGSSGGGAGVAAGGMGKGKKRGKRR